MTSQQNFYNHDGSRPTSAHLDQFLLSYLSPKKRYHPESVDSSKYIHSLRTEEARCQRRPFLPKYDHNDFVLAGLLFIPTDADPRELAQDFPEAMPGHFYYPVPSLAASGEVDQSGPVFLHLTVPEGHEYPFDRIIDPPPVIVRDPATLFAEHLYRETIEQDRYEPLITLADGVQTESPTHDADIAAFSQTITDLEARLVETTVSKATSTHKDNQRKKDLLQQKAFTQRKEDILTHKKQSKEEILAHKAKEALNLEDSLKEEITTIKSRFEAQKEAAILAADLRTQKKLSKLETKTNTALYKLETTTENTFKALQKKQMQQRLKQQKAGERAERKAEAASFAAESEREALQNRLAAQRTRAERNLNSLAARRYGRLQRIARKRRLQED